MWWERHSDGREGGRAKEINKSQNKKLILGSRLDTQSVNHEHFFSFSLPHPPSLPPPRLMIGDRKLSGKNLFAFFIDSRLRMTNFTLWFSFSLTHTWFISPVTSQFYVRTQFEVICIGDNFSRLHQQHLVLSVARRFLRSSLREMPDEVGGQLRVDHAHLDWDAPRSEGKRSLRRQMFVRRDDVSIETAPHDRLEVLDEVFVGTGMIKSNDRSVLDVM